MGGIFGGSKTQKSTSSSTTSPWGPSQDYLKQIMEDATKYYNQQKEAGYISPTGDLGSIYQQYQNQLNKLSPNIANQTNNLLDQGTSGLTNVMNQYGNVANGGMNISTGDIANAAKDIYNSDLVNQQIKQANQGVLDTLNNVTLTGIDRGALTSGNMGSSRAGIAQANALNSANSQMANNATNIMGNAYNQALGIAGNTLQNNVANQMAGIGGMGNTANSLFQQGANYGNAAMGGLGGYLQGANINQMITGANQADLIGQRDYLANLINQSYLPTIGAIGGMGGQSTGTQKTPGSSGLGQMGQMVGIGQGIGGMMNQFSDKRLKHNIKLVCNKNGINYYTWEWKDSAPEEAKLQNTYGVIAQEVMLTHPDAVHIDPVTGYYKVNYLKFNKE
ncbi:MULTISPECIES: tail fiber domain-containing protein [Citrobacter]|uniref:tail fiber domain-containing protein n=1 Tax=Citrobacter TaxID=544 RepID=UPI001900097B|nr:MULTISPECIES: tail fiber domain-containing protein [Citrobacter]MBJ9134435.1 tail fiber domain-containing protein [Citrobacter farmeri]MDM2738382.1 tail fiber domain-containing protein [Citrobacter sp. Ct235]